MGNARKAQTEVADPGIRERARATRASITGRLGQTMIEGGASCQAGVIAAQLGRLAEEWHEADRSGGPAGDGALLLRDRIETLSEALSYARATSPAGMLAQLAVAFDDVDATLNGRDDLRRLRAMRARRCLYSVAAALCALTGIDREAYGASHFMPGDLDWMACIAPEAVA